MKKTSIFSVILWLAAFTTSAMSASYIDEIRDRFLFTQWSNSDGFPTNNALDVHQDSKGYIWIATYDGVIRYNGNTFKLFNKYSKEGFNATSANVLYEDSKQRLWIGTNENGIAYYKDGAFNYFDSDNGFLPTAIQNIKEDKAGNIWVTSMNGLTKFIPRNDSFEIVDVIKGGTSLNQLLILNNDEILLTTIDGELIKYTHGEQVKYFPPSSPYSKYKYQALMQDSNKNLWFGTTTGEILKKSTGNNYTLFTNKVFSINKILEFSGLMNGSYIAFCSDNGIGVLSQKDKQFKIYDENDGLINNSIEDLVVDKERNIWIASKRMGLQKITVGKFKNYKQQDGFKNTLVNAVEEDKNGNFWIGTNGGLSILTPNEVFIKNDITKYFDGVRIRHILRDSYHTMWISTYGNKSLVRVKDNVITSINKKNGLNSHKIRSTFEDSKDRLWIGTTSGLFLIKEPQRSDIKILNVFEDLHLPSQYIMSITEDKDGNIVLGSNGKGIYILDKKFKLKNLNIEQGLSGDVVFKVFTDSQNKLWIATSGGISLFQKGRFYNFNTSDGLLNNTIFQVIEDNKETFWLTSSKGITAIKIKSLLENKDKELRDLELVHYDKNDGVLDSSTATSWGTKDSRGKLWFPTIKGISVLDQYGMFTSSQQVQLIIEEIKEDNKIHLPQNIKEVEPSIKRIKFKYASLSFSNPEKVKYQYYLSGFEDDWSEYTKANEVTYTNLPPGDYVFYVKATNSDGIWNDKAVEFKFVRKPAFHETIFFFILVLLIIIGVIASLFSLRIRSLNKKRKLIGTLLHDTITALTSAIDAKDPYTQGHSFRVAEIAEKLASKMGYAGDDLRELKYSALLHDIGKIGVEDRILKKPGKLTDEEFAEIQKHPIIGGAILNKGSLVRFANGAKYHHLKYGGNGYGFSKLKGEDIPLDARIIAVADVYDALISDRPYRKSLGKKVSSNIINKDVGTHFDPKVVEAFNLIIDELDYLFIEEEGKHLPFKKYQ